MISKVSHVAPAERLRCRLGEARRDSTEAVEQLSAGMAESCLGQDQVDAPGLCSEDVDQLTS